jgi:hypothetical protein
VKYTRKKTSRNRDHELKETILERHKRIKDERKLFFNSIIGLSGGAIILSVTLLEKIAPKKLFIWLIVTAWCLLALALITGVYSLVSMIRRSLKFQSKLERKFQGEESGELSFLGDSYLAITSKPLWHFTELVAGYIFLLGILFLGAFAILNLLWK